jgi:hypothetical protein
MKNIPDSRQRKRTCKSKHIHIYCIPIREGCLSESKRDNSSAFVRAVEAYGEIVSYMRLLECAGTIESKVALDILQGDRVYSDYLRLNCGSLNCSVSASTSQFVQAIADLKNRLIKDYPDLTEDINRIVSNIGNLLATVAQDGNERSPN